MRTILLIVAFTLALTFASATVARWRWEENRQEQETSAMSAPPEQPDAAERTRVRMLCVLVVQTDSGENKRRMSCGQCFTVLMQSGNG